MSDTRDTSDAGTGAARSQPTAPLPDTVVRWRDATAAELRGLAERDALAILPVASTEQHGPHLGTGVDSTLCEAVCVEGAGRARARGAEAIVAPTLPFGLAEHHMAFGGTFTLDVSTYEAVLTRLLVSVRRDGFRRALIVNGHGGNIAALNALLHGLAAASGLQLAVTTYFDLAADALPPLLEDQEGVNHACEVETSMMMALAPEAVRPDRFATAHGPARGRVASSLAGSVHRPLFFAAITPSGVRGDARRASATKGRAIFEACADALAELIVAEGQGARSA